MSKLKYVLLFLAGLLIGGLIAVAVMGKLAQKEFADKYSLDLLEQVYLLQEIKAGNKDKLVENLEEKLPTYVLAINEDEQLRNSQHKQQVFWRVKAFYECNKLDIPTNISEIMKNMPPQPKSSCFIDKNRIMENK